MKTDWPDSPRFFVILCLSALVTLLELPAQGKRLPGTKIEGVYRVLAERMPQFNIWIVDGARVRERIFPEFLYGGNSERYPFNPKNEIWIDNAIDAAEYRYTLAHELLERHLMARFAMSYNDAHDSALTLEHQMRTADSVLSAQHEAALPYVRPEGYDSIKTLPFLPDSLKLHGVYLQLIGNRDGIQVWIVNGETVRREIEPDFGFSGNGLAYLFIPKDEIWIDNSISCEETNFSIDLELRERAAMARGRDYDSAYESALAAVIKMREKLYRRAQAHPLLTVTRTLTREIGTGSER